ncbi:MAG TPA: glycoside hydrolase family 130 protein [Chryseosolibacter sp.]|nr:glycoside hydrolase family 130 protein [Chryseosolibacter sp.]
MNAIAVTDIARRFEQNPLVTAKNLKPSSDDMVVASVLNPGVFRFDKKTWLLVRVSERPRQTEGFISVARYEDGEIEIERFAKNDPLLDLSDPGVIRYKGHSYPALLSHLRLMYSEDGQTFHEEENYAPIFSEGESESYGIEDCRVTEINDIFYLTYNMVSSLGIGVGLMQTRDWKRVDRRGMILPPQNTDCAIFEEKIRDRYYALHSASCPNSGGNHIWIAESPDTIHWGHHKCIAKTRAGMWDSVRIGAGCSPIQTPNGWLAIYHGADQENRYCLGGLLLSLKDPSQVIARSELPFMEPVEGYESNASFGNTIFSNGHLVIGDKLQLYYCAGNENICGATLSIREILSTLTLLKK